MKRNDTPSAERLRIGFFGKRNSGKSSLVNALTGQQVSVVSDVPGTTTDTVSKAMELGNAGPVTIVDTPGIDDEGELGSLRVQQSYRMLEKTDIVIVVGDGSAAPGECEREFVHKIDEKKIPYIIAVNKSWNLTEDEKRLWEKLAKENMCLMIDSSKEESVRILEKEMMALAIKTQIEKPLVSDLVKPGDFVCLVTPIDEGAPKGRLILPQQQVIRELLENHVMVMVLQPDELSGAIEKYGMPDLVITDSQVFKRVKQILPLEIKLTSFSVLFARYKGFLQEAVKGAKILDCLEDDDKVLICEGCTHKKQCGDIGRDKLPAWILKYTGKRLQFSHVGGVTYPEDLSSYRLIIHCGGCMLTEKEMQYRRTLAQSQGVAMTNYGTAIAHMNQLLERSIEML